MHAPLVKAALVSILLSLSAATLSAEQTIVFFRHGEKPSQGLGQLTCQGLNRALELPRLLIGRFGRPDYVYAPDPTTKIADTGGSYFYVRPLATIEPTAIRAQRSVNTNYGFNDINGLRNILIRSSKADSTIFVAWEHLYLVRIVQSIMDTYGSGERVPAWPSADYDSLYVVRVNYAGGGIEARFERDRQNLNGLSTTCPN